MAHKQERAVEIKKSNQGSKGALEEGKLSVRAMIITGAVLFGAACLALFGFQIYWFHHWWGVFGALVGFLFAALCIFFPFLYLFKEGFSLFYFAIWLAGIVGLYGFWKGSHMFDPHPDPPPGRSIHRG